MTNVITTGLSSIIMCCYNGERFIHRSVGSILAQTYPNIELIFMDDGSTDNSLELIKSYKPLFESKGYILNIIHQDNQGQGFAAITGINRATGEYLSYLDVDDYLMPESIEKRVNELKKHPNINVVQTNAYKVLECDKTNCKLLVNTYKEKYPENLFEGIIMGIINNFAGTYMVRSSIIHKFYLNRDIPKSKYGQNLQLLLPCAYNSNMIFIDEPLMKYMIQNESHSNPVSLLNKIDLIQGYLNLRKELLALFEYNGKQNLIKKTEILFNKKIINLILSYQSNNRTDELERIKLFNKFYNELSLKKSTPIEFKYYNAYINKLPSAIIYRIIWWSYRNISKLVGKCAH